jgi:crossover junction endodeoxyribonuclease RuvC
MKILGIDPGYERLGIAILEKPNPKSQIPKLVFCECFKTSAKDEHADRLSQIQKELEGVIKKYKPSRLGIETLFFNKNVKTGIKVAEARGVVLAVAKSNGLEIKEVAPQTVKVAVTGYGKSDKEAVAKMIPLLVQMENGVEPTIDDEFDAVAAALAVC